MGKAMITCYISWLIAVSGWSAEMHQLLVLGPESVGFSQVIDTLKQELATEFTIDHQVVNERMSYEQFEKLILRRQPKALVLMDNISINYYRLFQRLHPDPQQQIPAVAAMALFMDRAVEGLNDVTGIRYEVPAIISLVHLRDLVDRPIKKVGVIYRKQAEAFIQEQRLTCQLEQIELVGVSIPNQSESLNRDIRKALDRLNKEDVDALWVLNDSVVLSPEALTYAWLPKIRRFHKPVVVGVMPLIDGIPLGGFAVLPDHEGIGLQISNLVFEILDRDFRPQESRVINPVSVKTILNLKQITKDVPLRTEKLGQVDTIIQ